MYDINEIYQMLDWNNDISIQLKGIKCAAEIKDIDAFIQPITDTYSKNIWDNCAKILYSKTDDELKPYLLPLFEWLQDINWPGALTICKRINEFQNKDIIKSVKEQCEISAGKSNDEIWINNLSLIELI